MSIGNLKDQGGKGTNFPYQLKTLALLAKIDESINAIPGVDFVTRTTTYNATSAVAGQYNLGDILVRYDIIDVVTSAVASTIWFNQTQGTTLIVDPVVGTYVPITPPSTVFVGNGPAGAAVYIQDGGNSITVDATDLDIRSLTFVDDKVDASNSINVEVVQSAHDDLNTNANIQVANNDVSNGNPVPISDAGSSLTVDSTNLDIRNLTVARDTVKIGDATHVMTVNPDGSVNINDGGGSITVDGLVNAVQFGTWNIGSVTSVPLAPDAATATNQNTQTTSLQLLDDAVATDGSPVASKVYQIGGADGTTARAITTDSQGRVNIADGGGSITVDGSVTASQVGTWNIAAVTGPVALPTGAATETTLNSLNNKVPNNLTVSATRLLVDGSGVTQPISGTVTIQDGGGSITVDGTVAATQSGSWNVGITGTVPLPTGAATEATLSALNNQFNAVTRTPSILRTSASGTISAGARSISVYNAGSAAGSILGGSNNILPGEVFSFGAGGENDTLAAFAYNGSGTTLVITTIV